MFQLESLPAELFRDLYPFQRYPRYLSDLGTGGNSIAKSVFFPDAPLNLTPDM
ncbi:unnamed protein product [Meloidogyne enterolobii]|uniref:Uncharacterized protein n=1 Tax=Meloidogyne enterolobii TaxID=390850 RepID=A0ACB1ANB5_MELEN